MLSQEGGLAPAYSAGSTLRWLLGAGEGKPTFLTEIPTKLSIALGLSLLNYLLSAMMNRDDA